MPSPRIHFGLPSLKSGLASYSRSFNLLEVRAEPAPPSVKHLARLRRETREGFLFTLVLGRALADLSTSSLDDALVQASRKAAEVLAARFILIRTPASAGPSARTRAKLARLVEALRGAATGIAWEPRGAWTDEELSQIAKELDVTLVRDLAEHDAPPGPVVYTRLLALGRNSRIGSGVIERVTDRLEGIDEAFIVIEGDGGAGVAKRLKASLGQAAAAAAEDAELDDAEDGEEDDDAEDGEEDDDAEDGEEDEDAEDGEEDEDAEDDEEDEDAEDGEEDEDAEDEDDEDKA
jgi:hypothetical protein